MSPHLEATVRLRRGPLHLDASLRAAPGETVALLGPNGAGKTTLVDGLAGLARLDGGRVVLGGEVLEDVAAGVRLPPGARRLGLVFQDLRLFPALTVRDNVAFGLRAQGATRREARQRAETELAALDIAALADLRPGRLSGGQAQRVALARALAVRPHLLLLDEPLSALDVRARGAARALLRRILPQFPGPRILVTHDPVEALALADRLVILEHGRVIQEGPPEEIRLRPRSPFAAALAGLNLLRGRIERRDGQTVVAGDDGELAVVDAGLPDGTQVSATVHPSAIALHRRRPRSSARNILRCTISDIEFQGARARVRLDSRPPLVAEITSAAVAQLRLAAGDSAWASVKATEIAVEPVEAAFQNPS